MGEITAASHEQTQGIEQINQAITQMDQVTQQNAALVEEASAAAQSLQEQAGGLSQTVSIFKLGQQEASVVLAQVQARSQPALPGKRVAPALKAPAKAAAKPRKALPDRRAPQLAVGHTASGEWTEF
jgi:methyl-accepting chemotaxis protein